MGGDGMDGLAWAIAGASLCILLVPGAVGGGLGYFILRKRAGWLGAILGFVIGAAVGALAVTATFFESSFSPPDTLVIEVPRGLRHEAVIFIVDPAATAQVAWTGSHLPMSSREGRITVPASGVLRVPTVDWIYGRQVSARLSTGARQQSLAVLDAPPIGGIVVLDFAPYPGTEPDLQQLDAPSLVALIRAREAER